MATLAKIFRNTISTRRVLFSRTYTNQTPNNATKKLPIQIALFAGGAITIYAIYKHKLEPLQIVEAAHPKNEKAIRLTTRERRFIRFASVEFNSQLYMTPQDFLESVVEEDPRPRLKRKILTKAELDELREKTPNLSQGSARLFRNLRDQGIISYTEYLFLLSILTKPQSGFKIAFNMFDTDGNERVDKNEFLVMEQIFSVAWKGKRGMQMAEDLDKKLPIQEVFVDDEQGLQRRHLVDTTLLIHFFGNRGTNDLTFENFRRFMLYLQTEVLELEFSEFSKGLPTIAEVDFAKILLRYTYLDTDEYDKYIDRLMDRIKDTRGITFEEFHAFCQFLNNLEDFSIAMRMYTLADHPISKDEFHRAVKICTGTSLTPHLIHTVFSIFDDDGDGLLSYREFIAIMKDRLHRGFKSSAKSEGWDSFKVCVKQEMRSPI